MPNPVVIGNATLYCGDCREILPRLGRVAAVVSDPPYGISYSRGNGGALKASGRRKGFIRRNDAPIVGDKMPFDPKLLVESADELILWGADHYAQDLPRGRWLLWDKLDHLESFDCFSDFEVAWHSIPGASRIKRHLWKGILKASENNGERREHPTQKPIAVMRWCIEQLKNAGSMITDPFMGSGTTGIAAIHLGRQFIGIEIEPKYFDIACRRIEEATRQPDMFVEIEKRAAQVQSQLDL